jgi:phosphatidylethanolamine/phosphatidyl-N-methylethanolamine N-methyltransferase
MAMQFIAQLSATALFLQEWIQRPRQIGAIAPSSKNLSSAMAAWLPADPDEYVLELGPGTGSVTEALLDRGLRHDRLIAIEKSSRMAGLLRSRFPRARIIAGDAAHMDRFMRKQFRQVECVGAVISSLPLRVFPPEVAHDLVNKIHTLLRPGGVWVQFSYVLGNSQPLGASQFQLLNSKLVFLNLPPARVSVYQKPLGA